MRRRPFGRDSVHVLSGQEAAAFDRWAIEDLGIPSRVLIEAAGRAAASVTQRLFREGPVCVFAGKGNNGADALVVARSLATWGMEVRLVPTEDDLDLSLLHGWDVVEHPLARASEALRNAAVVVDGVLGTGIQGAPRGVAAQAIGLINASGCAVVALDLPSGVDADTGRVEGDAVRADVTVGFGSAKLGAVLFPGRSFAGRSLVVDIGFPPIDQPRSTRLITPEWTASHLPQRGPNAHKNSVGAVCVVAGREGMGGAAVLAAKAALRSGAGYVRVVTDGSNREIVQSTVPEAVFVDRDDPAAVKTAVSASRAVLIGPGLGVDDVAGVLFGAVVDSMMEVLEPREEGDVPKPTLVVDADALTLLAQAPRPLPASTVLTPHVGEMERLTDTQKEALLAAPLSEARGYAQRAGVAVLLKGAPTVVVDSRGRGWVAASQSSDLAVAGMGDALAGSIAGLAAQGGTAAEAACVGLEVTARAAALAGLGPSLVPTDVIGHLADAIAERGAGDTDLDLPFVTFDQDAPR